MITISKKIAEKFSSKTSLLTATDFKVFFKMIMLLDDQENTGIIQTSQKRLSKELQITQPQVSVSLKKLCYLNFFVKTKNSYDELIYRLHEDFLVEHASAADPSLKTETHPQTLQKDHQLAF